MSAALDSRHESLSDRQQAIVERAKVGGFVTVEQLSESMNVSSQTIRRDIARLCTLGILRRYHGGASLVSNSRNAHYSTRQATLWDQKVRIAKAAAARIPDGSSLFIDIGTTAEAVARQLLDTKKDLRVLTTSLSVASMMAAGEGFEVTMAGGIVRLADLAVFGEAALESLNRYKVDFSILGISGVDADGTLLDFDTREASLVRVAIANSRTSFLVTDHTKFGRAAMVKVGHLSLVNALFLDRMPDAPYDDMIQQSGVVVHLVE
ncbi:DeoR/GlpR family DNA-binding transcription regulator [Consotaella salsifontis]|uniref:Transcriptional regulator, DeoR family n=1 Tax=Consotaella salsifontis TaxID=1365950 RepID=A0A1T4T285_9HYPH|nr:DeoR family transcriptional regulator [Consotaella salsifontis]SKA34640.1 transcriptional regulator, DeoR family [Consotaella salsifontis]